MSEKTYFGCMDFRNVKIQGSIRDNFLDGIGIVLDNQFMLCLSNWKNDIPNGPSLIIFPNRDYLYGYFKNRQLQDVCCYVASTGQIYFLNFANGSPSESIAYIDNNSTIIQIDTRNSTPVIKSSIKQRETNDKWKVISDIVRGRVTEDFQDYRSFIRANLLRDFGDMIQCSENAGLTFVGFKNTVSLGVKFDRNNQIRQLGNFEEFPRNLQYGKKFTISPYNEIKVEQGKFSAPEQVYIYKNNARSPQVLKQAENYFKKGTNFKNHFFRLNIFIQLSRYFSQVKDIASNSKSFQFGQRILQNQKQANEPYQSEQSNKHQSKGTFSLQQVKRDIINAANKRAKFTSRSPLKTDIDSFNHQIDYRKPSKKNSPEKRSYSREKQDAQIPKQTKRSRQKYKYINQIQNSQKRQNLQPKQSQYVLKYRNLGPQISDFNKNIQLYYRKNYIPNASADALLLQEKLISLRGEQLRRQQQIYRKYEGEKKFSPIGQIYKHSPVLPRSRSITPIKNLDTYQPKYEKSPIKPSQSKYQNYLDYKNRHKASREKSYDNISRDKNNNLERKSSVTHNLTPQKNIGLLDRPKNTPTHDQMTLNPSKKIETLPGRYKKTFKYLQ